MARLVIRNLDDDVKDELERRAARHDRSTDEEVREILRNAVRHEGERQVPLGSRIAARFSEIGLDEPIPELRGSSPKPS